MGFGISTALNYSARCIKQFLKVSTELLNIYVIFKKYIKSQNTLQAELKQLKSTIVFLEGVSTSSEVPHKFHSQGQ